MVIYKLHTFPITRSYYPLLVVLQYSKRIYVLELFLHTAHVNIWTRIVYRVLRFFVPYYHHLNRASIEIAYRNCIQQYTYEHTSHTKEKYKNDGMVRKKEQHLSRSAEPTSTRGPPDALLTNCLEAVIVLRRGGVTSSSGCSPTSRCRCSGTPT
jgi:hypothetical protein